MDPQTLKMEPGLFQVPSLSLPRRANSQSLCHVPLYSCVALTHYPPFFHAMSGPIRSPPPERIVQPPRPPNAWILYRSDKLRQLPPIEPGNPRRAQAEVSKMISSMWKNESDTVRAEYERRADAKKAEHQHMYPGYRFQPMKKEDKERMRTEKRSEKEKERAQSKRPRHRASPYATSIPPNSIPPMIPIYQPEVHYGPTGPSPPISAASSPNDSSPYTDSHPSLNDSSSAHASPHAPPTPISPVDPGSPFSNAVPPKRPATKPKVAQSPTATSPTQWSPPRKPKAAAAQHPSIWPQYSSSQSQIRFDGGNLDVRSSRYVSFATNLPFVFRISHPSLFRRKICQDGLEAKICHYMG
jgi:hypothetical protein